MDSITLKSTVLKWSSYYIFFFNDLNKVIGNYKKTNKKVPKATRQTTSTEEKENFLLDCRMLYSQNRTYIQLVLLLLLEFQLNVKVKEELGKLAQASLAIREDRRPKHWK